jgi:N-acetylneuraminic acid mutarotase
MRSSPRRLYRKLWGVNFDSLPTLASQYRIRGMWYVCGKAARSLTLGVYLLVSASCSLQMKNAGLLNIRHADRNISSPQNLSIGYENNLNNKALRLRNTSIILDRSLETTELDTLSVFRAWSTHSNATTLLADGRMISVCGQASSSPTHAVVIYDPESNAFTMSENNVANFGGASRSHAVNLLADGRVIVSGGYGSSGAISTSRIFNPTTLLWSAGPALSSTRYQHASVTLPDGKVLILGGISSSALNTVELYDPALNTWTVKSPMSVARSVLSAVLLSDGNVLVTSGTTSELYNPSTDTWTSMGNLLSSHSSDHTATLLPNGDALVVGGNTSPTGVEERFNPLTGTWRPTAKMAVRRYSHTATLLNNGKVLIAGGYTSFGATNEAELYDPETDTWKKTGSLNVARYLHTAHLLPSGKVIVYSGRSKNTSGAVAEDTKIEIYDPETETWSFPEQKSPTRSYAQFHLRLDGKVFQSGGTSATYGTQTSHIFDPETDRWNPAAPALHSRGLGRSITLPDGRIVYAAGWDSQSFGVTGSEIYDPADGTWRLTGSTGVGRYNPEMTTMEDGRLLLSGGVTTTAQALTYIFNPVNETWTSTGSLSTARYLHAQFLRPDGKILAMGGLTGSSGSTAVTLSSTELYNPVSGTWSAGTPMSTARFRFSVTELGNHKYLLAGGRTSASSFSALTLTEIYDAATDTYSTVAPMNVGRVNHAAAILPNGKVLVTGGYNVNTSTAIDSMEIYDPQADTWTLLPERLFTPRATHAMIALKDGRLLISGREKTVTTSYPWTFSQDIHDLVLHFWAPVQIEPMNCEAPYSYALKSGTGTLYPSGRYVPNQYNPETAEITVESSDGCRSVFTLTTR